jgi:hypothetical protein
MSGLFDQITNYSPPLLTAGQVNYKGTWSAAANSPTLVSPPAATSKGDYYVVSAAGTQFTISFAVGDWIISNGTAWEKVDLTDAVSSVFGRTGAVVGASTDYSSVGLTNTAIGASSPSTGAFTTVSASTPIAVASGGTGVSTSTGTTNVVLSNSPTIVTPVIAQINDASGNETLKLASIASAVNEVTIENAATGNAVHISATGGDASVGLHLAGKGASGYVNVQDSVDATKRLMFNAAGGTTNTRTMLSSTQTVDRTISLPDATDTLVGKATTDTLTNKTLTSPTLTTPILGTPQSGTLSSCTGLPISTGVSGLGTGIATALAINTGSAGAPVLFNGALGTPTSGTVTNLTGTASININGTVGATTASTGAFTSLSAQSASYQIVAQTSSTTRMTLDHNGTNGRVGTLDAQDVYIVRANIPVAVFGSTGLNSTAIGATTASTGAFTTLAATGNSALSGLTVNGAPSTLSGSGFEIGGGALPYILSYNRTGNAFLNMDLRASTVTIKPSDSTVGVFSSTGLAVTGALSSTTGATFATSSGNVGIGMTPSNVLDITQNQNASSTIKILNNSAGTGARVDMVVSNGTAQSQLTTFGTGYTGGGIFRTNGTLVYATGAGGLTLSTDTAQPIYFATNQTERARIDSSGNLLVGTTGAYGKLAVNSDGSQKIAQFLNTAGSDTTLFGIYIGKYSNDSSTSQRYIGFSYNNDSNGGGQINGNGGGQAAFGSFSDARLKENIVTLDYQLPKILALRPVEFDYKDGSGHQTGFVAQEMQEVYPDAVAEADGYLTLTGFGKTEARIIKAIQELNANLVAQVAALSQRLAALESN